MPKYLIILASILFSGCALSTGPLYYKSTPSFHKKRYKSLSHKQLIGLKEYGIASYYGEKWNGRLTANGERYNCYAITAAHKYLPFNSLVKVTDLDTGRSVIVRINDRGPYIGGRIIDLSKGAAARLGILRKGIARVKLEVIG